TFGTWSSSVTDLQVPYVFPQENGSRAGVVRATLTGPGSGAGTTAGAGAGLELRAERGLGLAVRPWSTAELDEKRHDGALRPDGRTWVTVSAALHGVGSAACGLSRCRSTCCRRGRRPSPSGSRRCRAEAEALDRNQVVTGIAPRDG